MVPEPMTLYKLMILHMLKQVNFPLTNTQLSEFFLNHEYTTYFVLQQALSELIEAGFINIESTHNSSKYEITKEGEGALGFFGNKISSAIIEDINEYLKVNRFKLRNEVGTTADYYKSTSQDYIVHCEVREGKSPLISLELSVPDEASAERICDSWRDRSQELYSHIMKTLMSK